eukprot:Tbor_TRINITY_DN3403_c0_g1::TRINITY_DN3403_c0_g1_i1::g.3783::m.3783
MDEENSTLVSRLHEAIESQREYQDQPDNNSEDRLPKIDKYANITELKKENAKFLKEMKDRQFYGSVSELRNRCWELKKQLDIYRGENLSLENVYANQMTKTNKVDKDQIDLNNMRLAHNDECRETRDFVKQLKEFREVENSKLRSLLKLEAALEDKKKFLSQHMTAHTSEVNSTHKYKFYPYLDLGQTPEDVSSSLRTSLKRAALTPFEPQNLLSYLDSLNDEEVRLTHTIQSVGHDSKSYAKEKRNSNVKLQQDIEESKEELRLLKEYLKATHS